MEKDIPKKDRAPIDPAARVGKRFPGTPSSREEIRAALRSDLSERELLRRAFELPSVVQSAPKDNRRANLLADLKVRDSAREPLKKLLDQLQGERKAKSIPPIEQKAPEKGETTAPSSSLESSTSEVRSIALASTAFSSFFDPSDPMYWFNEYTNTIREEEYDVLIGAYPDAPRIFAEGDSQFLFPELYFEPGDVVRDILDRNIPVRSIARAGADASDLITSGRLAYAHSIIANAVSAGRPFNAAFVSAGGNDLLGAELSGLLKRPADPNATGDVSLFIDQAGLLDFLNNTLRNRMALILQNIRAADSGIPIILHCYYLLFPGAGILHTVTSKVKTTFEGKGINNGHTQKQIIDYVVNEANAAYQSFADFNSPYYIPNCTYLDNRHRLTWYDFPVDEIHPAGRGFREIAQVFLRTIGLPA